MKRLLTLSVMLTLCMLTFATDFMRIKLKDGNIVRYEMKSIEEVDFEIGKDTSIIEDSTAIDISETPLKFVSTSDSTVEVTKDDSYKELKTVTIPAKVRIDGKVYDVTGIGEQAFHTCYMLTSLEMPASIKSIGDWAFAYCEYLKDLKISSDLVNIGYYAFFNCTALTEMALPSSVATIEDAAFEDCENLDLTIDNSAENVTVGSDVFKGCKSVTWLKD